MAMNITIIRSVDYLLSTVVGGDGPGGAVGYYTAPGTPPGRWVGSGVPGLGMNAGATITRDQAAQLFNALAHPVTGEPLGARPAGSRTPPPGDAGGLVHARPEAGSAAGPGAAAGPGQVVAGFDLTFRVPKSVSVLWGTASLELQEQIRELHHEAIGQALGWVQDQVLATRSGRGGVATDRTRGLVAASFDHFESRDGDPHLHTHVAVANRVQRAHDGKWLTIDGAGLMRSAVAVSERHENYLLDLLHDRLGLQFAERDRPGGSARAVVADVVGVPTEVVEHFSSRRAAVQARTAQLVQEWSARHDGARPPRQVVDRINQRAWEETRKPKDKVPDPLSTLTDRWRSELAETGQDPDAMAAAVLGHPRDQVAAHRLAGDDPLVADLARMVLATRTADSTPRGRPAPDAVTDQDLDAYLEAAGDLKQVRADLADVIAGRLSRWRSTWTQANAIAETERLTRLVRCQSGDRDVLTDQIARTALGMCVQLTPTRYRLPTEAAGDLRLERVRGIGVLDDPTAVRYTTTTVLQAEERLHTAATVPTPESGALDRAVVRRHAAGWASAQGHALAPDQAAAVEHLACAPTRIAALVGPAGTGKTTTLRALAEAWDAAPGHRAVIALAPSAKAASVLSGSLGVDASTLAGFLHANTGPERARRARTIATWHQRYKTAAPKTRNATARTLAKLEAADASAQITPGTLVIVDEAAMATTADLDATRALVEASGARMVLVGDDAQLDAVGAGGVLGRLARTGNVERLRSVFRFTHAWEAAASLRLRDADTSVLFPTPAERHDTPGVTYADAGRIRDGSDRDMLDGAYQAVRDAQSEGTDAILVAATNEDVVDLNVRTTLERRVAGEVDASRVVALRAGQDAGVGDLIFARRNNARLTDTAGVRIQNGDLLRVEAITEAGQAVCRRTGDDRDTRITLPADYLAAHTELGYALTAHRAQGVTVDTAHLVIPYGARMTRELLYVAMTRGKQSNTAWVGLPSEEDLHAEHTSAYELDDDGAPVRLKMTGATILARAMSASTAQSSAHETGERERERTQSLARLLPEHEHLAHLAAAPDLAATLHAIHGPDLAGAYTRGDAWDALVATWRRAHTINPQRTRRLLNLPHHRDIDPVQDTLPIYDDQPPPLGTDPDTGEQITDPARLTHWTLTNAIIAPTDPDPTDPGWVAGITPRIEADTDPAVADMARQCERLIADRLAHLTTQVTAPQPPDWVAALPTSPDTGLDPERAATWVHMATTVAAYRDAWDIDTATPLGPLADTKRQNRHRELAARAIAEYADPTTPRRAAPWSPQADPHADTDWSQIEPDEIRAPSRREASASPTWPIPDPQTEDPTPQTHPDPTIDPDDGQGPILWEPAYTLTLDPEPAWRTTASTPTDVDEALIDRLTDANAAALALWRAHATTSGSWVPSYLAERGLNTVEAAHAPPGWTTTTDHLRAAGFSDDIIERAGLAVRTRRDTLVDRFRDRAAIPILDAQGRIAGFTARINPTHTDPTTPKYLNTPTTPAFDKSTLLVGLTPKSRQRLAAGATPVIVEGAFDAEAVQAAGGHEVVALAACGTALTPAHLAEIAHARAGRGLDGVVAGFDDDTGGHTAAVRAWHTAGARDAAGMRWARWGVKDPADLAQHAGPAAVRAAVTKAGPLVAAIVEHTTTGADLTTAEGRVYTARAIAATTISALDPDLQQTASALLVDKLTVTGMDPEAATQMARTAFVEALLAYSQAAEDHTAKPATQSPLPGPPSPTPHIGVEAAGPGL